MPSIFIGIVPFILLFDFDFDFIIEDTDEPRIYIIGVNTADGL